MNDFPLFPVGNIKQYILRANQIQSSHRLFRAGAKLYLLQPFSGGDGYEHINVYGLPKNSSKMIRVTIKSRDVENFRIQKVFNPKILAAIGAEWDGYSEADLQRQISHWRYWSEIPYACAVGSSAVAEAKKGDFVLF